MQNAVGYYIHTYHVLTSHSLSAQRYWKEFLIDNWLILFPVFVWVNLIFDLHCCVRFDPCLLQNKLDWGVSLSQCRARIIFEGVKVKFRNWEFTKPGARQLWNQYWSTQHAIETTLKYLHRGRLCFRKQDMQWEKLPTQTACQPCFIIYQGDTVV